MNKQTDSLDVNSASVQSYLNILQGVINRMATNSAASKTWCITLVSAVIVIIAEKGKPRYVWISAVQILLFFLLDAYYLSLERHFRQLYNDFVHRVHNKTANSEDLFIVTPMGSGGAMLKEIFKAIGSISIWPFYLFLSVMLLVVRLWVI